MQGKVCLVTGATSGVGRATAHALAGMGAEVVVAARDESKAREVVSELAAIPGAGEPSYVLGDLFTLAGVKALADRVLAKQPRLDVLVNNAGAVFTQRQVTADGFERTFALNHLAYFALTHRVLPLLEAAPRARVVCVSSDAHRMIDGMRWDDLQFERSWPRRGWDAYCQSKLANILFTYELARRVEGKGITANCLHPGFVRTALGHNNGRFAKIVTSLVAPWAVSPATAARTVVYAAASPAMEGQTAKYLTREKIVRSSRATSRPEDWARLWTISAELTGVG